MKRKGLSAVTRKKDDLHSVLRRGSWFAGLDADIQARIEAAGRVKSIRRGDVFIRQGDEPTGLYAVVEGQIRAQATASTGKAALVAIFHPGDFFCYLACADGRPHSTDHVASVDSTVFVLPQQPAREIFTADQKLFLHLVDPQLLSFRKAMEHLITTVRLSPIQRLAERLLDLSRSHYYPQGDHYPLLGLSQELLASAVLCTRQTTNELIGELQSRGLIRSEYGKIEILDPDGLRKIHAGR
jgi:CRP-like cAMP-binding protein